MTVLVTKPAVNIREELADLKDQTTYDTVKSAGALMDSELANIAAVKGLNQGVATTSDVTFNNIDNTVIGGTTPAAISGTTGTFSGGVTGTDLTLSGGIYLGGAGAANYLDDYEEGSWTPASGGAAITVNLVYGAKYVKVGGLVHAYCFINVTTTASGLTIIGLPFTSDGYGPATIYFDNGPAFSSHVYVESGNSYFAISLPTTYTSRPIMISATYKTLS